MKKCIFCKTEIRNASHMEHVRGMHRSCHTNNVTLDEFEDDHLEYREDAQEERAEMHREQY